MLLQRFYYVCIVSCFFVKVNRLFLILAFYTIKGDMLRHNICILCCKWNIIFPPYMSQYTAEIEKRVLIIFSLQKYSCPQRGRTVCLSLVTSLSPHKLLKRYVRVSLLVIHGAVPHDVTIIVSGSKYKPPAITAE